MSPIVLSVTLALVACGPKQEDAANVSPPPPTVVVKTVVSRTVPIEQDYTGTTGAISSVDIRARVEGVLESAPFHEGSLVHTGQLLFTLQQDKYKASVTAAQGSLLKAKAALAQAQQTVPIEQAQANLAQKQASLERANITVRRVRPLTADKALPQKDLDNALQSQAAAKADVDGAMAQLTNAKVTQPANIEAAQGDVLSAQSSLADAKLNLSYTTISSPVTGLIGPLKYNVGNVVGGAGSEVLDTVTSVDPIKVNFAVDEETYLALSGNRRDPAQRSLRDQPLRLELANGREYDRTGSLFSINPTLDSRTGTISVEARFPNPDGLLRPGQFARVRAVIEQRPNALIVPQAAVVTTQGTSGVYTVDASSRVALRSVSLGTLVGGGYVVRSGLRAGDRVIVVGTQKVRPGMSVVARAG